MSSLVDESGSGSVGISESVQKKVVNFTRYVVAGSSPPTDYTKPIHILLKEAVASEWPNVTTDPPITDVGFSNTWFTDARDIEIIFLHSVDDRNINRRSTDWRFIPMATFVDIHIFVRGGSFDEEPPLMYKVRNALENVIEINKTRLIPHASVVLESSDYIPERDNQQTVWHWLYSCGVRYYKTMVSTV